ncbi:putative transcriptional regulator [Thermoplasmatales archaeon SCGC AB-539-N05]|nr:putative transcriptional regulator [Thermoplasmatales archaeon SCGC AB-539-N05]
MNIKNTLAEKIAGEITLSPQPGQTIKKWREIFGVSQTGLASNLGITPSVISDYESGRRKSPGVQTINRIIYALVSIDEKHGGKTIQKYTSLVETNQGILDIIEYPYSIPADVFIRNIHGKILAAGDNIDEKIVRGFTLIDSIKAIKTLTFMDYGKVYGWSTERALVFTGVTYGRSPMIAIRIHPMKPSLVVYHKPGNIDPLALKLAESEEIPLLVTNLSLKELKQKLELMSEKV